MAEKSLRPFFYDDMENARYVALFYKKYFGEDFYLEVSLYRNYGPMKLAVTDDRKAYYSGTDALRSSP